MYMRDAEDRDRKSHLIRQQASRTDDTIHMQDSDDESSVLYELDPLLQQVQKNVTRRHNASSQASDAGSARTARTSVASTRRTSVASTSRTSVVSTPRTASDAGTYLMGIVPSRAGSDIDIDVEPKPKRPR
ncbi:hypothetical protein BG000_007138, partial [Podila horticola]